MGSRVRYIIPLGYLLIVGFCMWQATLHPIESFDWFGVSMVLTLPWSIITFFLIMGAIHILGDGGIAGIQAVSAAINAGLLYLIFRPRPKRTTT